MVITNRQYLFILASIVCLAAGLRFYSLGEFQQLVFDEIYFAKFGYNHVTSTYYFDAHPPLSKYLIGAGIWLYYHLPWVNNPGMGSLPIESLDAVSWRWMNAFVGTLLSPIIATMVLTISRSHLIALLTALFIAIDGALIVESRFALNNMYLLLFGMLAILFLGKAHQYSDKPRVSLFLSGIMLGCAYSVKWNGLGFSLLAWILTMGSALLLIEYKRLQVKIPSAGLPVLTSKARFSGVNLWEYPLYLILLPFLVYYLMWQPFLYQFNTVEFFEVQKQMAGFHSGVSEHKAHPYCSKWYSWPLLLRPISYFYQPSLTSLTGTDAKYSVVHLLSNPALLWLSTIAIIAVSAWWLEALIRWVLHKTLPKQFLFVSIVVIGYWVNLLPWLLVTRCAFYYHYLSAALFSFMALAWAVTGFLESKSKWSKGFAIIIIACIVLAFIYWLPIHLGLPIKTEAFFERMWLKSWI